MKLHFGIFNIWIIHLNAMPFLFRNFKWLFSLKKFTFSWKFSVSYHMAFVSSVWVWRFGIVFHGLLSEPHEQDLFALVHTALILVFITITVDIGIDTVVTLNVSMQLLNSSFFSLFSSSSFYFQTIWNNKSTSRSCMVRMVYGKVGYDLGF